MRITYACPACDATVTHGQVETARSLDCPHCGVAVEMPTEAIGWSGPAGEVAEQGTGHPVLRRCLVCPSTELFLRKDFPQRLGVGIVVAGFAASCVTWAYQLLVPTFAILFGTSLIDIVLFFMMPECLTCYRCAARYRGAGGPHGGFNLETHERHRQQRIRLGKASVSQGAPTASSTS